MYGQASPDKYHEYSARKCTEKRKKERRVGSDRRREGRRSPWLRNCGLQIEKGERSLVILFSLSHGVEERIHAPPLPASLPRATKPQATRQRAEAEAREDELSDRVRALHFAMTPLSFTVFEKFISE